MSIGRRGHTATLLSTEEVLIVGGRSDTAVFSSCELYNPQTNSWRMAASMNSPRSKHTTNKIVINKFELIFVIGGAYTINIDALNSIEYYNVSSGTWTMLPNRMAHARLLHTTTTLIDNRLLVAGGLQNNTAIASTEIFDSSTFTWQTVGSLNEGRYQHVDAILADGNAFVAGGSNLNAQATQSCEVFDINSQTWSYTHSMAYTRDAGSIMSLLQLTNSILITGGGGTGFTTAELYYPKTDTMTTVGNMTAARTCHTSTMAYYRLTPIIVTVGGYDRMQNAINSVQLFIVSNSTWVNVTRLNTPRGEHTATLLNTSPISILIVGGRVDSSQSDVLDSTETLVFN